MSNKWHDGSDQKHAFCEGVTAGGLTWHLRPVTATGLHCGGGIDRDSLCGVVRAPYGWDIDVPVNNTLPENTCRACVAARSGDTMMGSR